MKIHKFDNDNFPYRYMGIMFFYHVEILLESLLKIIDELSQNDEIRIQAFNLANIVTLDHVIIACYHANKAFINMSNLSKSIDIEFLLYLSCQRQIKIALEKLGVMDGKGDLGICIFGKNEDEILKIKEKLEEYLKFKEDLKFSLPNEETLKSIINLLDISIEEIKSQVENKNISNKIKIIEKTILNKMALLSLEK
ncbi:MAG: hypothetical protein EAX96_05795 [Candidatus Lokiarchaeota archaeon]|nr:hypothetical protein [Candidatus Lokiarchaeota archaeon]